MTPEAAASLGFLAGVTISAMMYVLLCLFAYYRELFAKVEGASTADKVAAMVAMALSSVGYSVGRSFAKGKAAAKK